MQKCIKALLTFVLMICTTAVVFAQVTVTGTVTDERNESLIGVNVQVKGTTTGAVTDIDGRYSLAVPGNQSVLVFSYVGYLPQEIPVGNQRTINVAMREDTQGLEEVVVVGYGVQRKVTVTGAVATLRGEELKASPTTNLSNGIVGRMAGVIGFQRSDEPGGGGTTLRIRGTSTQGFKEPLYVIDGIPDRDGGFNRLNPGDIESISILKDATAAIYGSRAANGVVLITTKRGTEGKPTFNYSGAWGFSQPTRLPEVCDAFEYATLINEIDKYYKGTTGRYSADDLQKYKDGSDPWGHPNTDYYRAAIKNVSPTYRHELGVSGGTDRARYFVNFAALGEDGIHHDSGYRYDNFSIRTNIDVKVNEYLTIAFGNQSRMEINPRPPFSQEDIFSSLVRSKPTDVGFYPNGQPGPDLEYGHQPVVMATKVGGYDKRTNYYFQNDLTAVIKIPGIEGLSITPKFSYDKHFYTRKMWRTPFTLYQWTGVGEETVAVTRGGGDGYVIDLTQEMEDRTHWVANAVVNYNFTIANDHNFGIMAGAEGENRTYQQLTGYRKNFLSDTLAELNNGPLEERANGGWSWEEARLNYLGRVSYNFKERYLIDFIWRYDGSWRFPKEKRYDFFPGVSAAWRVSEEAFWKDNIPAIEFFKLRFSAAKTGMDYLVDANGNLDRSVQYLSTYRFGTDYLLGTTFNRTLLPSRTPNPNITWETQNEFNLGLELRMLNSRLSFEGDIYLQKRSNMLRYRSASLPQTSGITLPRENIGKMSNRGIEGLIRWDDKIGKLNYNIAFNFTYAKDRLDFIDEVPNIPEWQKETGKLDGTGLFYLVDGVFKDQAAVDAYPHWTNAQPGDLRFVDYNGDGKIDADDRVRLNKRREPLFNAGIPLGIEYKGLDVKLFFLGSAGGFTYIYRERGGESGNFFKIWFDNRWTEENPSDKYPRIYNREEPYWASQGDRSNEYFIRSTDFIRLRTAEIGYSFKDFAFIKNLGIQSLRIYAQGSNLLTFDKVKVQDPEQNDASRQYMQRRIINFGLSLTF
jgi:TonB-linked SusC/RagA family outer membrane protein